MKIKDLITKLHQFAPPKLAYEWDNVGFQIGNPEQEVKRVLLTLDVTPKAIDKAIQQDVQLIISHHPFIFRAIKKVTNPLIIKLIENKIGVLCAHTNLDIISNGVNKALADRLHLQDLQFIEMGIDSYHVAVYTPSSHAENIKDKVFQVGAGVIENYQNCSSEYMVHGQFKPTSFANPRTGEVDKLQKVEEIKLEFFVPAILVNKVIAVLMKHHPYEKPVYAVYPQYQKSENYGLGMFGKLASRQRLIDFATDVKKALDCPNIKLWLAGKNDSEWVEKIAICGGSGSSLLPKIIGKADVFVSADFTYHTILDSPIPLIDAGHFYTEYPILDVLEQILQDEELDIIRLSDKEHEILNLRTI